MIAFVLDASVAVKWSIPSANETLTAQSVQLLQRYVNGEINFIVPDVFWAEVGNVLWKGVRQRRWPQVLADAAAEEIKNRNFLSISSLTLLPEALRIAFLHDRSVYDCLYVALAVQFNVEMVTADERLANALAARLPVKWLGAF
ncbi:MAG TPA: type II toxin-antitoxin system VapC family toxin [Candidatus Sulfotelmatobacter sp.]|nr:type II toxin-antitoxin system VapC family toxin [Candidatus Sulfotelmatobacter sp.]